MRLARMRVPNWFALTALCGAVSVTTAHAAEAAGMEVRIYPSSVDPALKLSAEFYVPAEPRPLCLFFHGWHMTAEGSRRAKTTDPLVERYFLVNVDMRGRGKGSGKPDASGHELMDGLDALDYAHQTWPDRIDDSEGPYLVGGSGGGGNTMALAGKAPDRFAAAVAWAGMSDYALWYKDDERGAYRDEMEGKGWIGGSPDSNPQGYRSRGGLYVLENLLSQLLVIHGRKDGAVPVHHAEVYRDRAKELGKGNVTTLLNDLGHDSIEWPVALDFLAKHASPPALSQNGSLLVHSFVATRAFWLVLDDPARMGTAEYELDDSGRLKSVRFSQLEGQAPAEAMLLRISGAAKQLVVASGGETLTLAPADTAEDRTDFRWPSAPPWTATVVW